MSIGTPKSMTKSVACMWYHQKQGTNTKKDRIHKPRFTGITRLSNSRIDGRIAPAISQKQQTLAQRQRLFPDMMLEDCQDCILVGRAGHLLLTVDCNSTRTSRISIRGGGTCPVSNILFKKLNQKSETENICQIFVNFWNSVVNWVRTLVSL